MTILSSLAQDESRSISENSTWGIRRRFEKGQHKMITKRFLGYDIDEDGKLVVNQKQAAIVKRLYYEFLSEKRWIILNGYLSGKALLTGMEERSGR